LTKGVIDEKYRCHGKNKAGERCGRPCCKGRDFCKLHGGRNKIGLQHKSTKTGKYSKYMPERLKARYLEALSDPDLTTNRHEIAALETRMRQLIENVDDDVSVRTWKTFAKLWARFMLAVRSGDTLKQIEYVEAINEFIDTRTDEDSSWNDIERLADTRRKLADSEQRRMVAMNQMLTVEQAMMLMATLVASIKDVVYLYADPTSAKHIISGTSKAYIDLIGVDKNSEPDTGIIDAG